MVNSFSNSESLMSSTRWEPHSSLQQETTGSRSGFPVARDIADAIEHTPKAQRREKPPYGFLAIVPVQAGESVASASQRFNSKAPSAAPPPHSGRGSCRRAVPGDDSRTVSEFRRQDFDPPVDEDAHARRELAAFGVEHRDRRRWVLRQHLHQPAGGAALRNAPAPSDRGNRQ